MSGTITAVDLSLLPAPKLVEEVSFEQTYANILADLEIIDPDLRAAIAASGESDPSAKLLQVLAFREMILRQRINEAGVANMLAYAQDEDLDNLVAKEPYNIARLVIDPGAPDAIPPIDPIFESNEELRRRAQLAPSRFSTAGPDEAYIFHCLSADPQVLDASATSPEPIQAVLTILSRVGNGTASPELLDSVRDYLDEQPVRPMTDEVIVQGAEIIDYEIEAELTLYEGPDQDVILQTALARLEAYKAQVRRLGMDVSRSGIDGALHCQGVQDVNLISPPAKVVITKTQAAYCTVTSVIVAGRDE